MFSVLCEVSVAGLPRATCHGFHLLESVVRQLGMNLCYILLQGHCLFFKSRAGDDQALKEFVLDLMTHSFTSRFIELFID